MKFDLRLIYIFYFVLFVFLLAFHGLVGFSSNHVSMVIFGLFVLLISLLARYLDIIDIWAAPISRGFKIVKWTLVGLLFITLGFLAPNTNSLFIGGLFMLGLFGRYNPYVLTLSGGIFLGIGFFLHIFFSGMTVSYFLYYGFFLLLISFFYTLPIGQVKILNHRIAHLPIIFQESLSIIFSWLQYVIFLFLLLTWYYPACINFVYLFLFFHVVLIFYMKKRKTEQDFSQSISSTTFFTLCNLLAVTVLTMVPAFDLYLEIENGREYLLLVVGLFVFLCILISLHLSQGFAYLKKNFLQYVYISIGVQVVINVLLFFYSQNHFEYQDEIDISGIEDALPYQSTSLDPSLIDENDEDVKTMFRELDEAEKPITIISSGGMVESGTLLSQPVSSGGTQKVSGVTTTPLKDTKPQENSLENMEFPVAPEIIEKDYEVETLF